MSGGGTAFGESWKMEGGGTLTLEEEGTGSGCGPSAPDDGRGLYKVWVRGRGGSLLLGTLIPERGRLALSRTEPVHAGTGWLLAGDGRKFCTGIFLYGPYRKRGGVAAGAGSGAAVQRSAPPDAPFGAGPASSAERRGRNISWRPPFPFKKSSRCRCCSVWLRWRSGRGGAGWCGALTGGDAGAPAHSRGGAGTY